MHSQGYVPVYGNARFEIEFEDATVNVDLTDFGAGHNDMSWRALKIEDGAFRNPRLGLATIKGAFYGTEHQGLAGTFERDNLRGVFGALRDKSAVQLDFAVESPRFLVDPVEQRRAPGLFAAVIDKEGVKEITAVGIRRQGSPDRLTVNDLILINSNTKAMTATMLATLVADGTFTSGWRTTIADVFPELLEEMHKDYHYVELSQLVRMASGLPREAADWWAHRDIPDIIERRYALLRENLRAPPAGPAGEFIYSNLSYMIAGSMAERLTGKSWETLMRERLFNPLGMTTAGFNAPGTPRAVDQPWGHRRNGFGDWAPGQIGNLWALGPAGIVHLSIEDWAKFIALWFPDKPPAILDRNTLNELATPESNAYAAGWRVVRRGGREMLTHAGNNFYWYSLLNIYPDSGQAFIVATNGSDDDTRSLLKSTIETLEEFFDLSRRESLYVVRTQAPIADVGDTRYIGDKVTPPADLFRAVDDYNGVAVSSDDLMAEDLGSWDDTSFHLLGELGFEGGEVSFGVAVRNGPARPWASGPKSSENLADNSALWGTVSWNGALLGVTRLAQTVAGGARLTVELATLDGQLDFTNLEKWGVNEAPGAVGSGTMWRDGDLGYTIEIRGNTFVQTGGDGGQVTGAFLGAAHEGMGGVLERSDLAAGFGGKR